MSTYTLTKHVSATIPTQKYGNVDISTTLTETFEVEGSANDRAKSIDNHGTLLDKMIRREYTKIHDEMEKEVEKLVKLGEA